MDKPVPYAKPFWVFLQQETMRVAVVTTRTEKCANYLHLTSVRSPSPLAGIPTLILQCQSTKGKWTGLLTSCIPSSTKAQLRILIDQFWLIDWLTDWSNRLCVSGTLLMHGSNFGQMPFLTPPMTRIGDSRNQTKVQFAWKKIQHINY